MLTERDHQNRHEALRIAMDALRAADSTANRDVIEAQSALAHAAAAVADAITNKG